MSEHWFISGANRGIGLELTRQLVARGDRVTAGVRSEEARDALAARLAPQHAQIETKVFDTRDNDAILAAAKSIDAPIDVLVANAGAYGPSRQSVLDMDFAAALDLFNINTLGPPAAGAGFPAAIAPRQKSARRADVERAWLHGDRRSFHRDLFGDESRARQIHAMPRRRAEADGRDGRRAASRLGAHGYGRPQRASLRARKRRWNHRHHRRARARKHW